MNKQEIKSLEVEVAKVMNVDRVKLVTTEELKAEMELANHKPTLKERRRQKSSLSKITTILEGAANRLESFDLIDSINKRPSLVKLYGYFFPEAVEYVEVEVPQEPQSVQEHNITKKGNVVYVNFNK
jgi:hypothetical protein